MTREDIARKIRWNTIIWIVGFVNVGAMLPQLYQIIKTHEVQALSLQMFMIYFLIQVAFSLEGYFRRNAMLKWCLGLSALITFTVICLILRFR